MRNPSFEDFNKPGGHHQDIKDWISPNESPSDYYHRDSEDPKTGVTHNHFGAEEPNTGDAYAGICIRADDYETLQSQLLAPLERGKTYCFSMYISLGDEGPRPLKALHVNLSAMRMAGLKMRRMPLQTTLVFDAPSQLDVRDGWVRLCAPYTAEGGEKVLTIGVFEEIGRYDFSHYFIDDVSLVETDDPAGCHCEPQRPLFSGTFQLEHLNFETAKAIIRPESFEGLNELAAHLIEHPELKLTINGHTDHIGSEADNRTLSQRRTESVAKYLAARGVEPSRMTSKGWGESEPIASNATSQGRASNRRVEFTIE